MKTVSVLMEYTHKPVIVTQALLEWSVKLTLMIVLVWIAVEMVNVWMK